ncbi:DUF4465 domain-containing protein [Pseudoflavitalea rhizosphaerae]|uniref:DUF4465 domain-containing protein n=1 Tax=Pseudoflavitalea rhizosphaerae TaxID=1884793 RepID=UPI000F8E8CF9|nr:DUF4465 domain-containing protein [Pseudoflavitalea rhizosphaerae]
MHKQLLILYTLVLLVTGCSKKNEKANTGPFFYATDMLFEDLPLERFSHQVPDQPIKTGPATFSIVKNGSDWTGFALSNRNFRNYVTEESSLDSTKFSVYSGTAVHAGGNFLVVHPGDDGATISFDRALTVDKFLIAPTTFLYQAMMYAQGTTVGGKPVKTWATGTRLLTTTKKDYVKVIIKGMNGAKVAGEVSFLLADRWSDDDNKRSFTVNDWLPVSLAELGPVTSLVFYFDSSDKTDDLVNTPAYFCIDGIRFKENIY